MPSSITDLLERTALIGSFEAFIPILETLYPDLGSITDFVPILEGYESANMILNTTSGDYVLKIFEKGRDRANIESLVKILQEAPKVGVKVPEIIEGTQGYLSCIDQGSEQVLLYITKKFTGKNFVDESPQESDILSVTEKLAALNTLSFAVTEEYDSWGNKNLLKEYLKNKEIIHPDIHALIRPVIEEFKKLNLQTFSVAVIHGDLQRKHVFKNTSGEYCILDFGCMSYDAKVIDLSTHLAWYCFGEENTREWQVIFEQVIGTYSGMHSLSREEVESLPILVRASYAAYYMKTSLLIADGDTSPETREWNQSSLKLLQLSENLKI